MLGAGRLCEVAAGVASAPRFSDEFDLRIRESLAEPRHELLLPTVPLPVGDVGADRDAVAPREDAQRVRVAAGEGTKTVLIPIIDDVYVEGPETFTITLSNPTGASLGSSAWRL